MGVRENGRHDFHVRDPTSGGGEDSENRDRRARLWAAGAERSAGSIWNLRCLLCVQMVIVKRDF